MAKENIKRKFTESGVVLTRIFKKATNEFKDETGRTIPAQPDRWVVKVASSGEFNKQDGLVDVIIHDFKVTEPEYNKAVYLSPVKVTFEFGTYGNKPISIEFVSPTQTAMK